MGVWGTGVACGCDAEPAVTCAWLWLTCRWPRASSPGRRRIRWGWSGSAAWSGSWPSSWRTHRWGPGEGIAEGWAHTTGGRGKVGMQGTATCAQRADAGERNAQRSCSTDSTIMVLQWTCVTLGVRGRAPSLWRILLCSLRLHRQENMAGEPAPPSSFGGATGHGACRLLALNMTVFTPPQLNPQHTVPISTNRCTYGWLLLAGPFLYQPSGPPARLAAPRHERCAAQAGARAGGALRPGNTLHRVRAALA